MLSSWVRHLYQQVSDFSTTATSSSRVHFISVSISASSSHLYPHPAHQTAFEDMPAMYPLRAVRVLRAVKLLQKIGSLQIIVQVQSHPLHPSFCGNLKKLVLKSIDIYICFPVLNTRVIVPVSSALFDPNLKEMCPGPVNTLMIEIVFAM